MKWVSWKKTDHALDDFLAKADGKCAAGQHLLGRPGPVSPATACGQRLSHREPREGRCWGSPMARTVSRLIRDFSDCQNITMLRFHCFLFGDQCRVSSLWRPFLPSSPFGGDFWLMWLPRHGWAWEASGLVGKVGGHLACLSALDRADGLFKKRKLWDFPGGLVVQTPCFHCRGRWFYPWWGN